MAFGKQVIAAAAHTMAFARKGVSGAPGGDKDEVCVNASIARADQLK